MEHSNCHLYLDIDNIKNCKLLEDFLTCFCKYVQNIFPSIQKIQRKHVLVFDSSDEDKQSYHILIHLFAEKAVKCKTIGQTCNDTFPKQHPLKYNEQVQVMFENNKICGSLVKKFLNELWLYLYQKTENDFFQKYEQQQVLQEIITIERKCFLDAKVYNKNQNFRLFMSSKLGSNRVLRQYKGKDYGQVHENVTTLFDKSFITISTAAINKCTNSRDEICMELRILRLEDFSINTHNTEKLVLKYDKHDLPNTRERNLISSQRVLRIEFFADVINHFTKLLLVGSTVVKIISVKENLFILNSDSRYCHYKCDFHKSNHVYLCFDTLTRILTFKCFNDLCSNFSYYKIKIDEKVTNAFIDHVLEDQLFDIDDQ